MPPRPTSSAPGMAAKRIKKEIADLSREQLGDIVLAPDESDIFKWTCQLPGPTGSPYEGGVFDVEIKVPPDYPFSPPQLRFLTKVYHCNIASTGGICLDLLKHAWSPALSLYKVVLSLSSLLTDPNPSDPLVPAIAQEYKRDRKKHDATARDWVQKYALPKAAVPQPPSTTSKSKASTSTSTRPRAIQRPSASSTLSPAPPSAPASVAASSSTASGPAQIAGTRRSANSRDPIDLVDSDDDEEEGAHTSALATGNSVSGRAKNGPSTNGGVTGGSASGSASGTATGGERRSKRSRVNGNSTTTGGGGAGTGGAGAGAGASAGDAIVIDE